MKVEEFVKKPFYLVIGTPRSGTSMVADVVKACGYNFGNTLKIEDPRDGHNEHNTYTWGYISTPKAILETPEKSVRFMKEDMAQNDIQAAKRLVQILEFTQLFNEQMDDLRVLIPIRPMLSCFASSLNHTLNFIGVKDINNFANKTLVSLRVYLRDMETIRRIILDDTIMTLELPWPLMMSKNPVLMRQLALYLEQEDVSVIANAIQSNEIPYDFLDSTIELDWDI